MLSPVFKPFVEKSPNSVMARGMIERVLNPDLMDEWFDSTANEQYTKDLLFSTVFDLMALVVSGSYKSVHAAYQASKEDISVSITSVYNKLNVSSPAHRQNWSAMQPGKSNQSSKNWAAPCAPRCPENGSNCLMATVSKRVSIGSKRRVQLPLGRFQENLSSCTIPCFVCPSMYFRVKMAMPKSAHC